MPRRPRSPRPRGRRTLPARPPSVGAPAVAAGGELRGGRRSLAASERPLRLIERDAPFLLAELRRIVLVSGACFGLLVALVAVDRLS